MNRKKDKNATTDQLNQVFKLVEDSLRTEGILLPVEDAHCQQEEELLALPELFKDPMAVLARGREILANGLNVHISEDPDEHMENELAQAARNGSGISADVLARMHADRDSVESKDNG